MMVAWIIILVLFCGFFIILRILWGRIPVSSVVNRTIGVTILIPVRNEEENIYALLLAIDEQRFPFDRLEVLVIDDHSEDDTLARVRLAARRVRYSLKTIGLGEDQFGKKTALTIGNQRAGHELILCTDADTLPSDDWVARMTGPLAFRECQMVSGPVCMSAASWFERIQALEFMGLIGFGAISLHRARPTMCNGANMAYTKRAFREVDGYMDNLHIPSGDDEFLLRKISERFPGSVSFIKSKEALVTTRSKPSVQALWSQRVRWVSKWRYHRSAMINMLAVCVFLLFSGVVATLLYLLLAAPVFWCASMALMAFSWRLYLGGITRFFGKQYGWLAYAGLAIIYPYYAVILGIASIFGSYSWKGRKYR